MGFVDKSGESLEMKLFKMPLDKMLDALSAMEELDQCLLVMLEESSDAAMLHEWEGRIVKRRADRKIFRDYRLWTEGLL